MDARYQLTNAMIITMRWYALACTLWLFTIRDSSTFADLSVRSDFEGGSVRVLSIDQEQRIIRVMPGGDAQRGWACWWALRLEGLTPNSKITLELLPSDLPTRNQGKLTDKPLAAAWSMPDRAALSADGTTWYASDPGTRTPGMIRYEVVTPVNAMWIAWGPMFTTNEARAVVETAVKRIDHSRSFELAKTREQRPVLAWSSRPQTESSQVPGVWIQARQHAWESGSSWVARGFIDWLVAGSEPAKWLIDNAEVVVVPIMDVDNVATGNGGKEADPQDHNRDWTDRPIYPEVQAAQQTLKRWSAERRLDFFIDLHNPAPNDKQPFFFLGPSELLSDVGRKNRSLFLSVAQNKIAGPLPVEAAPRLTGPAYHPLWRQISGQWVTDHGNSHTLACCLETSWNTPHSNTDGYRTVGQQLGETIVAYLKQRSREP